MYPSFVFAEIPGGVIGSSNTHFTLTLPPNPTASLQLYWNGMELLQGLDYTLAGSGITTSVAPVTGDKLIAYYQVVGTAFGPTNDFIDGEVPTRVTATKMSLSQVPSPITSLRVFRNGILQQSNVDYSYHSGDLFYTFSFIPASDDTIQQFYQVTAANTCGVNLPNISNTPAWAFFEVLTGVQDGFNKVFALQYVPATKKIELTRNGLLQTLGVDYTLLGNVITFLMVPADGGGPSVDLIRATYRYFNTVNVRSLAITKGSFISYIRGYLNDPNEMLWDEDTLNRYIAQAEVDISQRINLIWARFSVFIQQGIAMYPMPTNLNSITRMTYRGFKIDMMTQAQLSMLSPVYRTQQSRPRWATWQFEGLEILRLYPVPNETLPILSDDTTIYTDANLQNEFVISGYFYSIECNSYVQIPDFIARRTIRYYVQWKAYSKEGNGQDLTLAQYFKNKYELQIQNNKTYNSKCYNAKQRQLGDVVITRPWRKARPVLPPNFGTPVDM